MADQCEKWDAMKAYFNLEPTGWVYANDGKRRTVGKLQMVKLPKIRTMLDDDHLRLSYMFLRDALPMFTRYNQCLSD